MKTRYILIVTLLCSLFISRDLNAQKADSICKPTKDGWNPQIQEIVLDFKTMSLENLASPHYWRSGQLYRFKIENINMNLYDVYIDHKDSLNPSTVSIPGMEKIELDLILSMIGKIIESTESAKQLTVEYQRTKSIDFNDTKKSANRSFVQHNRIIDTINNYSNQLEENILSSKHDIEATYKILHIINIQQLLYYEGKDSNNNTINYQKQGQSSVIELLERASDVSKRLLDRRWETHRLLRQFTKNMTFLDTINSQNKSQIHNILFNLKGQLDTTFKQYLFLLDSTIKSIQPETLIEKYKQLIHLENNAGRTYTSLPFQHKESISELNIRIVPKKPEYGPGFSTKYVIARPRTFAGVGASVYWAPNVRRDVYSISEQKTSDTTINFSIINEGEQRGEFGFASLLHLGFRPIKNQSWFGLNAVVGPSISIASQSQLRLTLGGGFTLGNHHNMLSVNALWLHGFVQKKSKVFEENSVYSKKPENITISRYERFGGLSLGYIYKF